jgi:hypothetical protein
MNAVQNVLDRDEGVTVTVGASAVAGTARLSL